MTVEDEPSCLEEATIEELHQAIKTGRTTCVAVVRHYIDRARAYNGVASLLVTEDGVPVPEAAGARARGGAAPLPERNRQAAPADPARSRQLQAAARD
jgi:Asp-tRNA(Asn)/Glu-tRNA(Gln) amidotransferase A subunit family amidase